jgi:hypothetical protein
LVSGAVAGFTLKYEYPARFLIGFNNLKLGNQILVGAAENIRVTMGGKSFQDVLAPPIPYKG